MIKTTLLVASLATTSLFTVVNDFQKELPQPVAVAIEDPRLTDVRKALFIFGRDPKYADAIYITATAKGIDPLFWACNINIESGYKINAISRKGYKGLGQTKKAIMKLGYEEADLMASACDLREKIRVAKGDEFLGLCNYKGGNNPEGRACAKEVYTLYNKIKQQINNKEAA